MSHDWIEAIIALAIFILGILASTVGWIIVRIIRSMDALEEDIKRHSKEIRDTRTAISYMAGQLKLPPPEYSE